MLQSAGGQSEHRKVAQVGSSCRLLIVPLFLGSGRFESLILSHHSMFTCECDKDDINDEDDAPQSLPLLREEGTTWNVMRYFTLKSRLDSSICHIRTTDEHRMSSDREKKSVLCRTQLLCTLIVNLTFTCYPLERFRA